MNWDTKDSRASSVLKVNRYSVTSSYNMILKSCSSSSFSASLVEEVVSVQGKSTYLNYENHVYNEIAKQSEAIKQKLSTIQTKKDYNTPHVLHVHILGYAERENPT